MKKLFKQKDVTKDVIKILKDEESNFVIKEKKGLIFVKILKGQLKPLCKVADYLKQKKYKVEVIRNFLGARPLDPSERNYLNLH